MTSPVGEPRERSISPAELCSYAALLRPSRDDSDAILENVLLAAAATIERLEEEKGCLRFELDGLDRMRVKDNAYLLAERDAACRERDEALDALRTAQYAMWQERAYANTDRPPLMSRRQEWDDAINAVLARADTGEPKEGESR